MGEDAILLFWRICGGALLALVAALTLSELKGGARSLVRLGGTVILLGGCVALLAPLIARLGDLADHYLGTAAKPYAALLLRCFGIALCAEIVSSLCRDGGESGLAAAVEMGGKLILLILLLPTVEELLTVVGGLLSGA